MKRLFIVLLVILLSPFYVNAGDETVDRNGSINLDYHCTSLGRTVSCDPPLVTLEEDSLHLSGSPSVPSIQQQARSNSVQIVFHHPVLHLSYTSPPKADTKVTIDLLEKRLSELSENIQKSIKAKIEDNNEAISDGRHKTGLKDIDTWVKPKLAGFIQLGKIAPHFAKFPDNVLVVYETEKKEVDVYADEYKDDIRSVSEVAGVSISKAKEILSRIKSEGYSISRSEAVEESNVKLYRFSSMSDEWPSVLNWSVTLADSDKNLITGYSEGFLHIRYIPKDAEVHVKAGYHDLQDQYKSKPKIDTAKQDEIDRLQKVIDDMKEKDKLDNPPEKRDIRNVTWLDVKFGRVKIEYFWAMGHGTGIFLGNMDFREDSKPHGMDWGRSAGHFWGFSAQRFSGKKSVFLTNAHVAEGAVNSGTYVSKDKEHLWFVYPGAPYVRYTVGSDHFGSPAMLLEVDELPVKSWDFDCAIMVSTPVAHWDTGAVLGNSDNVKPGDSIIMVGNPSILQKFSTEGIVSQTNHGFLKSLYGGAWLRYVNNKIEYNWLQNTSLWFDSTGYGGTSGSGVWALSGPEKGKIVALHNAGLVSGMVFSGAQSEISFLDNVESWYGNGKVLDSSDELVRAFMKKNPLSTANYSIPRMQFDIDNPNFPIKDAMRVKLAGLNAAIPINLVVQYLRERGLDFGRELDAEYFSK